MDNKAYTKRVKFLVCENKKYCKELISITDTTSIKSVHIPKPVKIWRSNRFLVQLFDSNPLRLTINRTMIARSGQWLDGILWDEIQVIKNQCGFTNYSAIEFYPPQLDLVIDHNMRHIWILQSPLEFMWKKN